jgi:hypothetical protein
MTGEDQQERGSELARFVGLILIFIGAMWVAMTGLCNMGFIGQMLFEGDWSNADLVLIIGAPSAAIGGVIYAIGRWLRPRA